MVRPRILHCDDPNCPHERQKIFSDWIRQNLPQRNFLVSDLDFILCDKTSRQIMWLEVKTRNKNILFNHWQYRLFADLAKCLRLGMKTFLPEWTFMGYHNIRFENTFFDDGKVFFDNQEISEEELKNRLSI